MVGSFKFGLPVNALDTIIEGIAITTGRDAIAKLDKDYLQIAKITDLEMILKKSTEADHRGKAPPMCGENFQKVEIHYGKVPSICLMSLNNYE